MKLSDLKNEATYVLSRVVTNPKPDRRLRNDDPRGPCTWGAGKLLFVREYSTDEWGVRDLSLSTLTNSHVPDRMTLRVSKDGKLLNEENIGPFWNLVLDAMEPHDSLDAFVRMMNSAHHVTAREILLQLFKTGHVKDEDVRAAARECQRIQDEENE